MFDAQHLYPIETVMQAFAVGVVLGFIICFKLTSTDTSATKEETPVFGFGKKNEMVPYKPSTAIQQSYAAPPVKPQKQSKAPAIGSGLFGGFMGLPLAQEAKEGEMIVRTDGTGEWGNEAIVRFRR